VMSACCVCFVCCGITVLAVVGVGAWGGITYNHAKKDPPTATILDPLISGNFLADPPTLKFELPVHIENTLGWPFKATITEFDADVNSLDIHNQSAAAIQIGDAFLDTEFKIGTHASANFSVWLDAPMLNPEVMVRLANDCGPLSSHKVTKLQVVPRKLAAKLVFGINIEIPHIPAQEFELPCDGLIPYRFRQTTTPDTSPTPFAVAV